MMPEQKSVVGRYAPSPSGRMHLGNAFSAIAAWLTARRAGGRFLLRIEDLDPDRCRPEYAEIVREDLSWLGLDWDSEVPQQSVRGKAYEEAVERLSGSQMIYPCFCSRADLHAAGAPHASDGTYIYAGTCRSLTAEQRAAMLRKPAWRIAVPDAEIAFEDLFQGHYSENLSRECGDFIIRRADGVFAYQLAVVVDDAEEGVNLITRGIDLLPSSARQLWLHRLLSGNTPTFAHVPLLTAPDGRRLSKRENDLSFEWLRAHYTAPELIGRLAALTGLIPEELPLTLAELLSVYDENAFHRQNIVIPTVFFDK